MILGPALNGRKFAAIPATPATTSDGDGNGVAHPNDLLDASLATARYLCSSGADLPTGTGWTAPIRAYNHSDAYVVAVLGAADSYAADAA